MQLVCGVAFCHSDAYSDVVASVIMPGQFFNSSGVWMTRRV